MKLSAPGTENSLSQQGLFRTAAEPVDDVEDHRRTRVESAARDTLVRAMGLLEFAGTANQRLDPLTREPSAVGPIKRAFRPVSTRRGKERLLERRTCLRDHRGQHQWRTQSDRRAMVRGAIVVWVDRTNQMLDLAVEFHRI